MAKGDELPSAYGGKGWSQREKTHREEIGEIWTLCGVNTEWRKLKSVLLHKPGKELQVDKPESAQMLEQVDFHQAQQEYQNLIDAYEEEGIEVHLVKPQTTPPPNLVFMADLFFMTPEGAILARPASTVRAGEERIVLRELANIGIPMLGQIRANGTFEAADATWLEKNSALVADGLRTNVSGAQQLKGILEEIGVEVIRVGLPIGSMHLMGVLRFLSKEKAIVWPGRTPYRAVEALKNSGYDVLFAPDLREAKNGMALNFVTLDSNKILMPKGNPVTKKFLEDIGVDCLTVSITELSKAAGGIGCMTGILERELK
ncbi:MAG: arginine deiminase family protein [Candidatus Thorarchaeota archaeon]